MSKRLKLIEIISKWIYQLFGCYPIPVLTKFADKNYVFKQNLLNLWSFVILILILLSLSTVLYYGDLVFNTSSTAGFPSKKNSLINIFN